MDNNNIFPGWKIVEEIGEGSFGKVYKISKEDGMGGEYFSALKVVNIPYSKEEYRRYQDEGYDDRTITKMLEDQVKAVTAEFKLLSGFRGTANIVSFEDHKVVPKESGVGWEIFIRMELLNTLPNVYKTSPLTVEDTVKLGIDICNALILCEKKNIIHRDIKPQNIFVNEFGDYKLGDFGIARNMDHATQATKIGTPAYMAPEVYRGDVYGSNVDIYSLGMVLYWALNERRLPFVPLPPAIPTSEDIANAQQQRLAGVPLPPPKNGTEALKQAVLKACAFDPKARFATAAEFKAALSAAETATAIPAAATVMQDIEKTEVLFQTPPVSKATVAQDVEKTEVLFQTPPAPKATAAQDVEKTTAVRKAPSASPNATAVPSAPKLAETKKTPKKGGKKVLIALICLLLVAGIGVGAYFLFFNNNDDDDDSYAGNANVTVNTPPSTNVGNNSQGGNSSAAGDVSTTTSDNSGEVADTDDSSVGGYLPPEESEEEQSQPIDEPNGENSSEPEETSKEPERIENATPSYTTYTVILTDNGDGTATITATLPAGIESGKIVISTGDNLQLIEGSATASVNDYVINEAYAKNGVSGVSNSFAYVTAHEEGTVALSAEYIIKNGVELSLNDFSIQEWSLTKNGLKVGTQNNGDVKKIVIR